MPVIITLVVFVLLSFCGIFLFFYIKKHRIFVEKNSIALDQLSNINEKYNFENVFPSIDPYYFDNAKLFNEVSCEDYLIY